MNEALPQDITSFICKCKGQRYYCSKVRNNLVLEREPENMNNTRAIKILNSKGKMVDYVEKKDAARLATLIFK